METQLSDIEEHITSHSVKCSRGFRHRDHLAPFSSHDNRDDLCFGTNCTKLRDSNSHTAAALRNPAGCFLSASGLWLVLCSKFRLRIYESVYQAELWGVMWTKLELGNVWRPIHLNGKLKLVSDDIGREVESRLCCANILLSCFYLLACSQGNWWYSVFWSGHNSGHSNLLTGLWPLTSYQNVLSLQGPQVGPHASMSYFFSTLSQFHLCLSLQYADLRLEIMRSETLTVCLVSIFLYQWKYMDILLCGDTHR